MRIALFTDTYYQINGVSMVYQRFARWCADKGIELEIFTPGNRPEERLGTVTVRAIRIIVPVPYYHDLYFDLFDIVPLRPLLSRIFKRNRFDIIHIATQGHMAIVALRLAARHRVPKIACYHTALPEFAYRRILRMLGDGSFGRKAAAVAERLAWYYQRKIYGSSNLVLVPTETSGKVIRDKVGVPTALFTRGVDSEAFRPDYEARSGRRPVTLYVGRISVEKNLDLMKNLDADASPLVLVGDGPELGSLRRELPYARFTGSLVGEELRRAYATADIFAFPSRTDTFGNAVLEAMSSGLAVLVTDSMGPKDFVRHGETGFVAAGDAEFVALHSKLAQDAKLRRRLGANAREYAKTRKWDEIFETELLGNYRRVVDEGPRE